MLLILTSTMSQNVCNRHEKNLELFANKNARRTLFECTGNIKREQYSFVYMQCDLFFILRIDEGLGLYSDVYTVRVQSNSQKVTHLDHNCKV